MEKVYLSGTMSGLTPKRWRVRFLLAKMNIAGKGYEVINPAETIIARHVWLYKIIGYRRTLWYDLRLLRKCQYIHMVGNDWYKSRGARLERMKARKWNIIEI